MFLSRAAQRPAQTTSLTHTLLLVPLSTPPYNYPIWAKAEIVCSRHAIVLALAIEHPILHAIYLMRG